MPSKNAYNYKFRLYIEGVHVPFHGAVITCTPNGVEANINLWANKELLDLKPKTAVQIFYREWHKPSDKAAWLLAFDGFYSSLYKVDQAGDGNNISIVCRDFRMDIRRAPAALAWEADTDLTTQTFYNEIGLFQTFVVKGASKPGKAGTPIRIFDSGDLAPLSYTLGLIAGSAFGNASYTQHKSVEKGKSTYVNFADVTPTTGYAPIDDLRKELKDIRDSTIPVAPTAEKKKDTSDGVANCGFFLDAIVRGLWNEAVGGTVVGAFINKRIRMDKRFLIPVNKSGYNFWRRQSGGANLGSHMMGNSRFTSLEAAIMNLAGMFSTRVYSCNSPTLISISDDDPAINYIMDKRVKNFILGRGSKEFGGKYLLNESMLLPPLEFTAPPNCNFIFPPMCDRIEWQHDIDVDITRGRYEQVHLLSTPGGNALSSPNIQVPNALFSVMNKSPKDAYGRPKPPLTLEERYKGVNVEFGSVSVELACNDASSVIQKRYLNSSAQAKVQQKIDELKNFKTDSQYIANPAVDLSADVKKKEDEKSKLKSEDKGFESLMTNALKHHAVLKFLNSRYAGRVVVVNMAYNPFLMCGFPGDVVADNNEYGKSSSKSVLGMVQMVRHTISISSQAGDATTSVTMNNARFEDEATDINEYGYPLYMKDTVPKDALIDIKTFKHINSSGKPVIHYVDDPKPPVKLITPSKAYDLSDMTKVDPQYKYAKDLLSITLKDEARGKRNQIYIDPIYEPIRISKFYHDVFKPKELHFMIGRTQTNGKNAYFTYDSIHEGIEKLRINRPDLLTDYTACMNFTERKICSADAFFNGILGLSVAQYSEESASGEQTIKYINKQSEFSDNVIHERYFGVSTSEYNSVEMKDLKKENGGEMTGPGQFSSIREHSPVTAFIQERRDAVETYLAEVLKRVSAI